MRFRCTYSLRAGTPRSGTAVLRGSLNGVAPIVAPSRGR